MATASEKTSKKSKKWFPLESNPALLNRYIAKLGFDTSFYRFVDVFSTEEWALAMIPPGAVAVVFLYPITPVQEEYRQKEKAELFRDASKSASSSSESESVWHIKQRIGNACGTIGVLHALGNIPEALKAAAIPSNSWLGKFYESCPPEMDNIQKAEILEGDDEIESKHDAATSDRDNQTSRGNIDDKLETHFVAVVCKDGGLYELDGRKEGPVRHGDTSPENFLKDACKKVVQTFMDRDPGEMRFTMLALAPTQSED